MGDRLRDWLTFATWTLFPKQFFQSGSFFGLYTCRLCLPISSYFCQRFLRFPEGGVAAYKIKVVMGWATSLFVAARSRCWTNEVNSSVYCAPVEPCRLHLFQVAIMRPQLIFAFHLFVLLRNQVWIRWVFIWWVVLSSLPTWGPM